jgi:TM2 domain-containing membrane protein YozV
MEEEVESILAEAEEYSPKSATLARWLSTFIPGSGQIYASRIGNGINAFILDGALGYFLFSTLHGGQYQTTIFGSLPLFARYYRGNRHNAGRFVHEYNDRKMQGFRDRILAVLSRAASENAKPAPGVRE